MISIETKIKPYLANYFGIAESEIELLERLKGGMSNSNYVVRIRGELSILRLPGKNAEVFVDRNIETNTLALIQPLRIDGNAMMHLDSSTGYKISRYLEGQPISANDPAIYYPQVAHLLHLLHDSGFKAMNDYDPFHRLKKYEQLVESAGLAQESAYYESRLRLMKHQDWLQAMPLTICHNDAQTSNFLVCEAGNIVLLDWEFGGNNDPLYDVACYGNHDFKYAIGLLPYYLGRAPKKEEWERMYLWRVFQCLQWHNVALYKESIGLSQELGVDFKIIAHNYIKKADDLYNAMLERL